MAITLTLLALLGCPPPGDTGPVARSCAPYTHPPELAWEDALLGAEAPGELLLNNPCSHPVEFTLELRGSEAFTLPWERQTLPVGESVWVEITFTPQTPGVHAGEVLVHAESGEARIALGGTAAADWDGDGHDSTLAGGGDCDDADPRRHPDREEELCDQVDSDCNGSVEPAFAASGVFYTAAEAAAAVEAGELVTFCPGTHAVHIQAKDRHLHVLGWSYHFDRDGHGPPPEILTGEGGHRIFDVVGGSLGLASLTLAGGSADGDGGAIRASGTHLDMDTVVFEENSATGSGGALLATGDSEARLYSTYFTGNTAGEHGGALFLGPGVSATLHGRIHANQTPASGAAWVSSGATLEGHADWGAGDDDNMPWDVACEGGATYEFDEGWVSVTCDGIACEQTP